MHVGLKILLTGLVVFGFAAWLMKAMEHEKTKEEIVEIKKSWQYEVLGWILTVGFYSLPVGLIIWIVWR